MNQETQSRKKAEVMEPLCSESEKKTVLSLGHQRVGRIEFVHVRYDPEPGSLLKAKILLLTKKGTCGVLRVQEIHSLTVSVPSLVTSCTQSEFVKTPPYHP